MNTPQTTLYIDVTHDTSQDSDYPEGVFLATNDLINLATYGETFDELLVNLREALAVCLEETDTVKLFNLVPQPRVVLVMELPQGYAQTA